jgi:hypothetical protein
MTTDDQEDIHPARRRPLRLQEWDSWLDKTIEHARRRGDFDDLPGHGKPLQFDANPLTGEIDVGYGILKSAGVAPAWIELDKEIRAALDALATMRNEASGRLGACPDPQTNPTPSPASPSSRTWWRALFGRSHPPTSVARSLPARRDPEGERLAVRERYLERAREIDTKIAAYNASLPPELWHLERARLTPERAARDFDDANPPRIGTSG